MIVELALVTAGLAVGAGIARALRKKPTARPEPSAAGPRRLRLGDVLVHPDGDLWIQGRMTLREGPESLTLLRTQGAPHADWLLEPRPDELHVLVPTVGVPPGRVPSELRRGPLIARLIRRGPVAVETEGEGLPPTTPKAELVVLGCPNGDRILVLDFADGSRLALEGRPLDRGLVDVLPGGDAKP
ncbi:MAG: hypothetical protein U0230_20140 [Polyangiales bacterium]